MKSRPFPTGLQTIRSFIMYDALAERDPFDGYKTFCKVIGTPDYDYVEYEYWYYRFYHGNLDLHYDRSLDPVQPKFDELPNEVLVGVVEHLDLKTRLQTRKVSRKLRQLSHKTRQPVRIDKIEIILSRGLCTLGIGKKQFMYFGDILMKTAEKNRREFYYGEESTKFAISDFRTCLEIPKLEIDKLSVSQCLHFAGSDFIEKLRKISDKNISNMHVAHVEISFWELEVAKKILALLAPGFLEKITLSFDIVEEPLTIDELASMEQLKQAKSITVDSYSGLEVVHLRHFYRFEEFKIRLNSIQPADVVALRDALASSAHFKTCSIKLDEVLNVTDTRRILGFEEQPNDEDDEQDVIREKQILPNPQEFLRIRLSEDLIYISKESIESYETDWPSEDSLYEGF